MAKFNKKKSVESFTKNYAGGLAYKQSKEMEFVNILLTNFVNDQFYRKENETIDKLKQILTDIDPLFAAKACIYARDQFGMRSVSHVIASELAKFLSGKEFAKSFYEKVVVRPDDMLEIASYYGDKCGKKFPSSLKKGFQKAFDKFDTYQLAKWRGENSSVKLVDIVNLVHPVPNERNSEGLKKLVTGELKNTKTWESMLSQAGQTATSEEDLVNLKTDAWGELLKTKKIGYFALIRNLRNIIQQAPEHIDLACELLTNERMIQNSRVLPFRFTTAYEQLTKLKQDNVTMKCINSLNEALNLSIVNVPKFSGETLVVIDTSGSMSGKPSEIASLFGSMIAKKNFCDVMTFDNYARYVNYNPLNSILDISKTFKFSGGGTNVESVFTTMNKAYENIILLSDFQAWIGRTTPTNVFKQYKEKYNCEPHVFSWDLQGLGTLVLPESKVYCLSGFSEKVFDIMELLKSDKKALINKINEIVL